VRLTYCVGREVLESTDRCPHHAYFDSLVRGERKPSCRAGNSRSCSAFGLLSGMFRLSLQGKGRHFPSPLCIAAPARRLARRSAVPDLPEGLRSHACKRAANLAGFPRDPILGDSLMALNGIKDVMRAERRRRPNKTRRA